jgi:spore coat protein U-like protein
LSSVWGDGSAGTSTQGGSGAGLGIGSAITHTVYGELPNTDNNQNAPAGNYSDTVTVTVEY